MAPAIAIYLALLAITMTDDPYYPPKGDLPYLQYPY
jgi:hypothetical protein